MRIAVALATLATLATLAALGAFALGRLGETLGQLRALDTLTATRFADRARSAHSSAREPAAPVHEHREPPLPAAGPRAPASHAAEPAGDSLAAAGNALAAADERVLAAHGGDERIRRWLAADVELQRSAEQLLQDPDPGVQREARELLRELGALDER